MTDNITNRSGGVDFNAAANVAGDAVGRDKNVVETGGGAHTDGNVAVGSGKFVGRDDHSTTTIYEAPVPIATAFHQLPAPPLDFVGRTTELNAILNDLQHGAVITGLRGLGGIGKTTLALVIAERMKDQYPDAQFYINLHGASDKPLSPAEALAHVIRAYHPTAKLPEDVAELQALYCSVLNDQRALILLDDARDAAQVRPLLPPARSACLLLITSRQHFTLPGLHATDLDTLPPDDARKLLLEIAPHLDRVIPSREAARNLARWDGIASTPPSTTAAKSTASAQDASRNDVASEIAYFCGYLPQALRAAGSLLAVALDLDPLDYAAQLRDERTRLERLGVDPAIGVSVEASLNLSYALLSLEAQRVFGQLSVFPASFDATAEEAICVDEGHRHLSTLLQLSLAQYNTTTKRYSLHDLVRLFAAKHTATRLAPFPYPQSGGTAGREGEGWGEGERTAAQRRHAEYYKNVLSAADDLYLQGNDNILRALALFDAEWPNFQAGQAWAAACADEDTAATQLCLSYPDVGVYTLDLRLHYRDRIRWLEAALKATRRLKDRKMEGIHLGNIGLAYADLGETPKAIEFYQQALIIDREIGDRRGEGTVLANLGVAYKDLSETRKAIEFYEQALIIDREIGDRRGEGNALGNLGVAYYTFGETRKAIEFYGQALIIDREIGDRRGEGNALGNLGVAYYTLGETPKAIELYEQQLRIVRDMSDEHGEGNALGNLGSAYAELGEMHEAIEFYEQQLQIVRKIGDRHGEGNVLGNLGVAYKNLDETRKAIEFYEQQLGIVRDIGDRRGEGNALGNLGIAYAYLGETSQALELYKQTLIIHREIGDRRGESIALWNIALALDEFGKREKAIANAEVALKIFEQIEDPWAETVLQQLAEWRSSG